MQMTQSEQQKEKKNYRWQQFKGPLGQLQEYLD